jgi:hypothetical protein
MSSCQGHVEKNNHHRKETQEIRLYFIYALQKEVCYTSQKDLPKIDKIIKILEPQQSGILLYLEHQTHTVREKRSTATYKFSGTTLPL